MLTDGLSCFWLHIIVQPSSGKQVRCQHPGTQKYQGFPENTQVTLGQHEGFPIPIVKDTGKRGSMKIQDRWSRSSPGRKKGVAGRDSPGERFL